MLRALSVEAPDMAQKTDPFLLLEEARKSFYGLPDLPLHRRLGLVFERDSAGAAAISLAARPELLESDGRHRVTSLFTLAEVAAGVHACDAIWPYAAERGMVAVGLTLKSRFSPSEPAFGTIRAATSLISDVEQIFGAEKPPRKAIVEVAAELLAEDGARVGEYREGLYARFMDQTSADALTSVELSL
jgi:hypothetical protein